MRIFNPGHTYICHTLDGDYNHIVQFVKREGEKYPGNVGSNAGTNLQELFRVCIDRLEYLQKQEECSENSIIIHDLKTAIWLLEMRAARRHKRVLQTGDFSSFHNRTFCPKCGHVGCEGDNCALQR